VTRPVANTPPPLPAGGPAPVPYARPGTVQSSRAFDLRPFFTHLATWAVLAVAYLAVTVLAVPKFEAIFKDFKLDLPLLTKLLLTFSRWPNAILGVMLLVVLAAGDSVCAGFLHRKLSPTARRFYRLAVYLLLAGAVLFLALALLLPLIALMDGIAGKK
jgi:type II secretory pathway component PulF